MNTVDVAFRNWLGRAWIFVSGHYCVLLPNQKAYVNSAVLFFFYFVLRPFWEDLSTGFLAFAFLLWGMALCSDLLTFYSKVTETILGKIVLVAIASTGVNVAVAMSAQLVNDVIGWDPGSFVHTIAFVSIFQGFTLTLFVLGVLFAVGIVFGFIFIVFHFSYDERLLSAIFPWYVAGRSVPHKRLTVLVQAASFLTLCWFAYSWVANEQPRYQAFIEGKARLFLYSFEMYEKAPTCSLTQNQRVAFLEGGQVLVANKVGDEITFTVRSCPIAE